MMLDLPDYPSYEDLVRTFAAILLKVDDNDYQGDSRVLVADSGRFGLLFFGWGSCSGCDALEAAQGDRAALTELRDDMARSTYWEDTPEALVAYIDTKDWGLDFRGDAGRAFRQRAREILLGIAAGRLDAEAVAAEVLVGERKAIGA